MLFPLLFALASSNINSVAISGDGKYVAAAYEDGTVIVWDAAGRTEEARGKVEEPQRCVAISHDGSMIASGGGEHKAYLWSRTGHTLGRSWTVDLGLGDANAAAFSSGDSRVAWTTGVTNRAVIFDVATREQMRALTARGNSMGGVALLPDKRTVVTGGQNLIIWDLEGKPSEEDPREPKGGDATAPNVMGWTVSLDADRKGKWIVAAGVAFAEDQGFPRSVLLIESSTHKIEKVLAKNTSVWKAVAISPAGKYVAGADEKGNLTIWSIPDGRVLSSEKLPDVNSIAFSPDEKTLAVAIDGGRIKWLYTRSDFR